jgi:hypothetical protein
MQVRFRLLLTCALAASVVTLNAQGVTKEMVPGVANFTRVETTIACAGATTPAAVGSIKKMGYASIIKRIHVDKWDADRAGAEAEADAPGLTSAALETVALDYVQAHKQ